jgi:signal transduction histidine kinase
VTASDAENGVIKKTILYIEDDDASRVLVRKVLETVGYRVLTARDGLLGIDAAQRYHPDLILMDINLPHLSGEAVTTRLRGMPGTRDVPIVALTSQTSAGDKERALVAGCTGFLNKPIDVDKFPSMVAEYLDGRRDELSGPVARRFQAEYSQSLVARLEAKVRQLEELNHHLRRIDKMKGDFINLTSHEMRTPLTLVQGYAHLLEDAVNELDDEDPGHEITSLIRSMVGAVGRLSEIVNEILSVSRIATGQLEPALGPIHLREVVDKALKEIKEICAERRITVTVAKDGWPTIQADGEMMRVAIRNLLSNAVKYTPDGGRIGVDVEVLHDNVDITVEDTGIGIDPEEHLLIFEQFYTAGDVLLHSTSKTNFKGGGLGLGLAIAKGVADAHKGKIWVESAGRDEASYPGSRFHLLLPIDAAPTVSETDSSMSAW